MWWFPALASLLITNVGSEDTSIPEVLQKVASRIDLAVLQFGHHFTHTPLGILHGKPASINSSSENVSGLLFPWHYVNFCQSCPEVRIWRIQVFWSLLLPNCLPWESPAIQRHCLPQHPKGWRPCFPQMGLHVGHTDWRKGPELIKCLFSLKSFQSWEIYVATLRKAK